MWYSTHMRVPARPLLLTLVLLAAAALLVLAGDRWSRATARSAADAQASAQASARLGLLSSELQKFRLLPLVLADHPDIAPAMRPGNGARAAGARLNRTLELLARRTDAAAIYAVDRTGRTVAASNWRRPDSFVGQDYGFRPYFTRAMARGTAELFALGTVSRRPGLYLSRRVEAGGRVLGVVVAKVEFDRLERAWARAGGVTLAEDAHGVVLVTGVPGWRFAATRPLSPATLRDARRTLQFGTMPPARAPVTIAGSDARIEAPRALAGRYRAATLPAPLAGGRVVALLPLRPALAAARGRVAVWALGAVLVAGTVGAVAARAAEKRRLGRAARIALEEEVARRTADLRDANARLQVESSERAEAERRFRSAREELAQANRLGSLGQIVAGVAHEINQPVAAIRAYAENGVVFLDRAAPDRARDNLGRIVALAARIGTITAELRAFARRGTPAAGAVPLRDVLDGVRLLMGERLRAHVRLGVPPALAATKLAGDRVRLEQVLVNLLGNALEATAGLPGGAVHVSAEHVDGMMALVVADNGPGVPDGLHDQLFTPFASSKPEGLGLGLAIARTIAREFGGDLVLLAQPVRGAAFKLTVPVA